MIKICLLVALATCAEAAHYDNHDATSHVIFNNEHNTVHHIHSAATVVKATHSYAAPSQSINNHAAPTHSYAVPSHSITGHSIPHAQSFSSLPVPSNQHAAPVSHYVSAPVHHHLSAPSVHSVQYSVPLHHNAHYTNPFVAKVAAPILFKNAHHQQHEEEYAPAKYEFAYGVQDHHTDDIHSHKEIRDGDVTRGEYSLHEADGTIRTVKYSVDKHSGFNAVVERSGHPTRQQKGAHRKVLPASHHGYHH